MFTKSKLMTMKKDQLVATAQQTGADLTQANTRDQIADKILEKLSVVPTPANAEKPKAKAAPQIDKAAIEEYLNTLEGVNLERDGDVVTLKYRNRETCLNINTSLAVFKRAISVFMMELPRPIEAQLQR